MDPYSNAYQEGEITGKIIETLNQISEYSVDPATFIANKTQIQELYIYLIRLFKTFSTADMDGSIEGIDQLAEMVINHISDLDNPHMTTYLQVGFTDETATDANGNVFTQGLTFQAQDGTIVELMSPNHQAFTTAINNLQSALDDKTYDMANHIADMDNPHQTTYLQTGFSDFADPSGTAITGLQITSANGTLLTLLSTTTPQFVENTNNIAILQSNLSTLQSSFSALGLTVSGNTFSFTNGSGVQVALANQVDLTSAVNALTTSLQTQVSDLQSQITQNATDIATNQDNIATNQTNIATNQTNITTLQGQMTTANTNINTNTTSIANINSRISNINNTADLDKPASTAVLNLIGAINATINNIQGVDATQTAQIATNTDNINALGIILNQLQAIIGGDHLTIEGPFETTDAVTEPNVASMYLIGDAPPFDLYIYQAPVPPATTGTWVLIGTMGVTMDNLVTLVQFNAFVNTINGRVTTIETTLPTMQSAITANANAIAALQTAPAPTPDNIGLGNVQNVDTTNYNNITSGQIQGFQFMPYVSQGQGGNSNVANWIGTQNLSPANISAYPTLAGASVLGLSAGTVGTAQGATVLTQAQLKTALGTLPIANGGTAGTTRATGFFNLASRVTVPNQLLQVDSSGPGYHLTSGGESVGTFPLGLNSTDSWGLLSLNSDASTSLTSTSTAWQELVHPTTLRRFARTATNTSWGIWREYAYLDNPNFTGIPTAPTPATTDNSTQIATTAFVRNQPISNLTGNLPINRIVAGTATGQVLRMTSATASAWGAVPITDTTGNLPLARITPGTNGQVLGMVSGNPTWVAAPTTNVTLANLPSSATANRVLLVTTANSDPQYAQVNLTNMVSGRLPMGNMPTSGTANRVLLVGGTANANPVYGQVDLGSMVTGTLPDGNIANTIARLASPAFTGTPTAPTAGAGTNTTQIATTAFVQSALAGARRVVRDQTWVHNMTVDFGGGTVLTNNVRTVTLTDATYPAAQTTLEVVGTTTTQGTFVAIATLGANNVVTFNVRTVGGNAGTASISITVRYRIWQGVEIVSQTVNRSPFTSRTSANVGFIFSNFPVLFVSTNSTAAVIRGGTQTVVLYDNPLGSSGSGATGNIPVSVFGIR